MKEKEKVEYSEIYEVRRKVKRKALIGIGLSVLLLAGFISISSNEKPKDAKREKLVVAASSYTVVEPGKVLASTATATPKPTATPAPTPIGSKVNVTVNYKTNKIQVKTGSGGSNRFYISTDKQKNWNLIYESTNGTSTTITMELAGYLKSSETKLYFKGNKDIAPVEVVIPKESTELDVEYKVVNDKGVLVVSNKNNRDIEYRLNDTSNWQNYTSFDTAPYEDTGLTLEFRTKATEAFRAGKIVKVKIPKRPSAPSVKLDYSKMVITGLKYKETQYRMGNGEWKIFLPKDSKVKSLNLYELLLAGVTDTNTQPMKQATIEFRQLATDKKVASAVKLIEINAQPSAPGGTVSLNGSTLTISDASKDKPYEYVVLQTTETMDVTKVKWKKVTTPKPIVINKTGNASTIPGDKVYVRLASYTEKETKRVTPPSLYKVIPIVSVTPGK